jgi:hypothetical protein
VVDNPAPLDPQLFVCAAAAVREGLARLELFMKSSTVISHYHSWYSVGRWENGMASIHEEFGLQGPTNYADAFKRTAQPGQWDIPLGELSAFDQLHQYLSGCDYLRAKLLHPFGAAQVGDLDYLQMRTDNFALNLIDRYMHIHKGTTYQEGRLLPLYLELERGLINDHLPLDVVVPILFLAFDFDSFALDDDASIERLSTDVHMARAGIGGAWDNTPVRAAVSHALRITGYTVPNPTDLLSQAAAYPIERIDQFFAAIRIVKGAETGYSQLLAMPDQWADRYQAWLPPIRGTSTRAYPPSFEMHRWLQPVETIGVGEAERVATVFSSLQVTKENKIRIALKRLNRCYVRADEEDTIIDAAIGLEALLADDSKEGIVHRLAMRIAALARVSPALRLAPPDVFRTVKQIYDYRSRLVHGDSSASKRREITLPGGARERTVDLAVRYLRFVLEVLLDRPEYRKPDKIDEDLLAGFEAGSDASPVKNDGSSDPAASGNAAQPAVAPRRSRRDIVVSSGGRARAAGS